MKLIKHATIDEPFARSDNGLLAGPLRGTKTAEAKATDAASQSAKDVADIKAMEDRFTKAFAAKHVSGILAFYPRCESRRI